MVVGGDSCSGGRVFKSQSHLQDGHFSHEFVVKIYLFEKTKINEKEAGNGPIFLKKEICLSRLNFINEKFCI